VVQRRGNLDEDFSRIPAKTKHSSTRNGFRQAYYFTLDIKAMGRALEGVGCAKDLNLATTNGTSKVHSREFRAHLCEGKEKMELISSPTT
jgi:hypothetical protein